MQVHVQMSVLINLVYLNIHVHVPIVVLINFWVSQFAHRYMDLIVCMCIYKA